MGIRSLSNPQREPDRYRTIMGIDSSSLGVAWTLVDMDGPVASGKIKLDKIKEIGDKLLEISEHLPQLLKSLAPDHIFIEMPIFVKNPATARLLSFVVGAIITIAVQENISFTLIEPTVWKSFLGVTNLSSKFQAEVKSKLGKTEGTKLCNRLRKSQTQRIIKYKYPEFDIEDNDISDSCAIALYGLNKLSIELLFPKNKEIAFDLQELSALDLYP